MFLLFTTVSVPGLTTCQVVLLSLDGTNNFLSVSVSISLSLSLPTLVPPSSVEITSFQGGFNLARLRQPQIFLGSGSRF